jgi:L-ectoine synthase
MIVRTLDEIIGTDRDVDHEGWNSRRLLLKNDGMGFSMHDTIIKEGAELHLWYKYHLEAVYCIEGKGSIETVSDGKRWTIEPGTIYALNEHDQHILRAEKQMRMVCTFNPPVTGREVHDKDGAYAPPPDDE